MVVPDAAHDIALALAFGERGGTIRAALPAETLEREVPRCGISLAEDQLEIVQKATELVRKAVLRANETPFQPPAPGHAANVAEDHPAVATITGRPEYTPTPSGAGEIEISSGFDLLIRGGHADPMGRLGGRLGLTRRLGVHLTTGLSGASEGGLEVLEGQVLVGLGYRFLERGRLSVEGVAAAGLLLHHYASAVEAGDRIDELALLAFTGSVRLSRHAGLELRLAPGLSQTEYVQVAGNGAASWTRSRFRIEAGVGLVFQ